MYQLVRTRPSGTEKIQQPFGRRRDAAGAACVLLFHKGVGHEEAQTFANRLRRTQLGETLTHQGTGYSFRVEQMPEMPFTLISRHSDGSRRTRRRFETFAEAAAAAGRIVQHEGATADEGKHFADLLLAAGPGVALMDEKSGLSFRIEQDT